VFGLSFGELCVLLIVAMVVLGPRELPRHLRKAGQLAGRLRRLAFEMREKSGIDDVLRSEGIDREIAELRRLARGEITGVASVVRSVNDAVRRNDNPASPYAPPALPEGQPSGVSPPVAPAVDIVREREYPREGADSYGALPDTAVVYDGSLAPSALAEDSLYVRGELVPKPATSSESSSSDPAPTPTA
jgi:sec-independent protein translocase protein TatB